MDASLVAILLFVVCALALSVGIIVVGRMFGPRRRTAVKGMPYESGMNPLHDTHRRFDVRFHLVAIAFLVFDVEVLLLYPWAAALRSAQDAAPRGIDAAVHNGWISNRQLVFWSVAAFFLILLVGYIYDWRKGVFRWR